MADTSAVSVRSFSDRLADGIRQKGTPVLVGLDPRAEQLPAPLLEDCHPQDVESLAYAYCEFCRGVIDVVAPHVAVVKPQAAFFEQLGPPGMQALAEVVYYARHSGLLVILDGKRNDIGSTAEAYADAWLSPPPDLAALEHAETCDAEDHEHELDAIDWRADALTVSPYLGDDSLEPFVQAARERAAGVFVLVKTSNPGGATFQDLIADGRPLYRHVAAHVERIAAEAAGECGYGSVGAVVGATYPEQLAELREAMPHAWFLVPGFGAQGGTARDTAAGFDAHGLGAIVNNSRGIIFAHAKKPYAERFGATRWQEAVEAATLDMIAQLRAETSASKLAAAR
ncbi:MAG: orotidine-5'-phosphate decarboxylase [Pirellulales bacterium]|nr:orotidine-5'-phosphate decarboxylase [Pirellulales bacterium]